MILKTDGSRATANGLAQEILFDAVDRMLDSWGLSDDQQKKLTPREERAVGEQVKKYARRVLKMTPYTHNLAS